MAKMTLIEMVQDILSDLESDEVNSINDSTEALQVAQIVKTTYYAIVDGRDYPWFKELFQLETSGTTIKPTHMKLPETIIDLEWIKYNCRNNTDTKDKFLKVEYKDPEEFLNILDQRSSDASNITVITDSTGIKLNIINDNYPRFYTSFDDEYVVFDAYDSEVDSTLQNSKSQCHGKRSVPFLLEDDFVPDMPVQMFSYLLNDAKSAAFLTLKQMPNQKIEQRALSQKRRMSKEAWKISKGIKFPHYGRK
mgnify:FL=1|jgi:hypothetical protein